MMLLFYILLAIAMVFLAVDAFHHGYVWQSRIKIGRLHDAQQWQEAVKKRAFPSNKAKPLR
ncbi:hypothetical protein, partial [Flavobacterium sp.]|uniref:hypothetical protein n=1 Tax=Flavobacterium sp. TaxID=239 RepID=UPI00391A78A5